VHGGEDHARATGKAVSAVAERLPAGRLEKGRILDELCAAVTRERGRTDEIWHKARAASPPRRSSNANCLCGQNSAGFPQICATFQRDNLRRHF
jgi:hypothetical protein